MNKIFCFYWKYIGWHSIGIGFNIDIKNLRLELHLPSGYLAIGFHKDSIPLNWKQCSQNEYGWGPYRNAK